MGSLRNSPQPSGQTPSLPGFKLYPSVINKDSKAQHVLGLSRTELHNARHQSLIAKSNSEDHSIYPSKSFSRNPLARAKERLVGISIKEVKPDPVVAVQKVRSSQDSDIASISQATSLRKHPSNSTLRSFYDAATAPLRISQQTSDSSSRDFALRKGEPTVLSHSTQEMEHSKQLRLFKSPKLRSISENKKLDRDVLELDGETAFSPISRRSSYSNSILKSPITRVSSVTTNSSPHSPQKAFNNDAFFVEELKEDANIHPGSQIDASIINSTLHTPYAKIHVRRPKAGTRNWFDDLEGVSSDDEENTEPELQHQFVVEVERAFRGDQIGISGIHARSDETIHDRKNTRTRVQEIAELPADDPISISKRQQVTKECSKTSLTNLEPKNDPLARADLSKESILCLSTSDDEHEDDDVDDDNDEDDRGEDEDILLPLQTVQSSISNGPIRGSISLDNYDDSDVEVGLTHTAQATGRKPGLRPSPIKLVTTRDSFGSSSSLAKALRGMSQCDPGAARTFLDDEVSLKDADDDVILSSFPATPSDINRPRSSVSLSDDRSIVSMRLMKVTRQEENLIAAMRMKRAAMKRAEKAAARKSAQTPDNFIDDLNIPLRRSSLLDYSGRLSGLTTSPSSSYPGKFSLELDGNDAVQDEDRSLTALTARASMIRGSEVPLMSRFSGDSSLLQSGRDSLVRSSTSASRQSLGPVPRPHSFLPTSTRDGQRHEDNIIVLDNLNSGLPTAAFPSQLFIESPFLAWEKVDSATVH